jgi:hypothetical protein
MVIGNYNKIDETAYFVVGNGDTAQLNWFTYDNTRPGSRNCFTVGNDGTEDYITIGSIKLTENVLSRLITFINAIDNSEDFEPESGDPQHDNK